MNRWSPVRRAAVALVGAAVVAAVPVSVGGASAAASPGQGMQAPDTALAMGQGKSPDKGDDGGLGKHDRQLLSLIHI